MNALKSLKKIPKNGIAIFCGLVAMQNGEMKENETENISSGKVKLKKILVVLEPIKPIEYNMYKCDDKFHVEDLLNQLKEKDKTFGFIIINGDGSLFAKVTGTTKEIIHEIKDPDLPKKHCRGGQSSNRFAKLRTEARHNYTRFVAEAAKRVFIGNNDLPNVTGIIIAGCAGLKHELINSGLLDQRLTKIIKKIIDIPYGGRGGLEQAIVLALPVLEGLRFSHEKELVDSFIEEILKDSGKIIFGVNNTMQALEMGAIEKLLIWDELPIMRYKLLNLETKEEKIIYVQSGKQEMDFLKSNTLEIVEKTPLIEYLVDVHSKYGSKLELISDQSSEGKQFCVGFGGIGGFLRYQIPMENDDFDDDYEEQDDDEFM